MKACFFDIETSNLKPNFAVLLTAAIKPLDGKPVVLFKGRKGSNDKELCKAVKKELEKYDIVVTYYGLNFDMKFLNSRLIHWKLGPVKPLLHIDDYRIVKKLFNTHSRRLETICQFVGIEGKTHIEPEVWLDAAYSGDKKAIMKIVDHNYWDVVILERLHMDYLRDHVKSISRA